MNERYLDILEMDKSGEEQARITEDQRILDVYTGDHEGYMKDIPFDLVKKNIFRKVIDKKIGTLYQTEPAREIDGVGYKIAFQANIEKTLTNLMKRIMLNIELFGKVYVDWTNREMFSPKQVFLKGEKTMVLKKDSAADEKFQWVYSEHHVYEFVNKKLVREMLPSGLVTYEKDWGDYKKTSELADLQLEFTKISTFSKTATILQSVDQIFTDDNELRSVNMSPEVVNFKSRDSSLELLHFKADLVNIRENEKRMEEGLYEMGGIPRVSVVGDVASRSAKELTAKWFPLVETYRALAREYGAIESQVVADIFWELYKIIFEKDRYHLRYDRDFLPTSIRDTADAQFRLENNVITVKDLIREENPVLPEAEIDFLLAENIRVNKQNQTITKIGGPSEPGN